MLLFVSLLTTVRNYPRGHGKPLCIHTCTHFPTVISTLEKGYLLQKMATNIAVQSNIIKTYEQGWVYDSHKPDYDMTVS